MNKLLTYKTKKMLFKKETELTSLERANYQVNIYKAYKLLEEIESNYSVIFDAVKRYLDDQDRKLSDLSEARRITGKKVILLEKLMKDMEERNFILIEQISQIEI